MLAKSLGKIVINFAFFFSKNHKIQFSLNFQVSLAHKILLPGKSFAPQTKQLQKLLLPLETSATA